MSSSDMKVLAEGDIDALRPAGELVHKALPDIGAAGTCRLPRFRAR